jgi:hypothetical protein
VYGGAGLFAIIPVLDSVVAVIDERIQATGFNAEQALKKDGAKGLPRERRSHLVWSRYCQ